ncbi:Calvin cycle protein CP12 [Nodosilinea sp. LEGE 07298]|uniref:Calvin cycle protein CP12 n=1 Tax=Nodosilinea sp. LEGE 07298 TaxID=2777970 RepID=UPI0018805670|nr:Calvin cycle protein CP12 [Nodosilinea sp. LEGE 07298]MBE9113891.1 Calvin cycle protein CP12 [Nodosilinea sp. LEGE 07298]
MSLTTTLSAQNTAIQPTLESRLQVSLEHARRLTALYGTDHVDVAIAWETVEELSNANSCRRVQQSAFARYCEAHPDAPECRIYED